MKAKLFIVAALGMAVVATPVGAADDESGKDAKEKLICKTDGATGSRIRKNRVCKTEAEWREYQAQTQNNLDRYSNRQGQTNGGAGQAGGPG
ncbi:hypothetical protein GRI89_04410 [Altererythrobacter salegens]|uniref:Uncharacterized protein n=1 Tax=Croceibacterium salegens TaxID=1737568 RepID=A0A6I4SWQ3_9SPHN|nr:hypothetical protein [Croceibacterium salegens]MXO58782.1 hypothetical protein [Croceibacterium salegens]